MPAVSSLPILSENANVGGEVTVPREILAAFALIPDPRSAQGRRHGLVAVLALAGMAVITGARSVAAIGQWAQDVGADALRAAGIVDTVAGLSTFHRVCRALDAERFDRILYAWCRLRFLTRDGWRVIAADGKTVRGARDGDTPASVLIESAGFTSHALPRADG